MSKITNPMPSMQPCNHAFMLSHHIILTHLFFPSSYLLSFPASLFTLAAGGKKDGERAIELSKKSLTGIPFYLIIRL
jgi:hypothetical protein